MIVQGTAYGILGMLDVYMKHEMNSSDSDISVAFLMFGIAYIVSALPSGLVRRDISVIVATFNSDHF